MLALRSPLEFPVGTATSPSGVQVTRSVENSTMLRTSLKRGLLGKVRVSSPPSTAGEGARDTQGEDRVLHEGLADCGAALGDLLGGYDLGYG